MMLCYCDCVCDYVMNITWMDKITNEDLYGNLPRISNKIRERRLKLAGHCVRLSELEVSNLVLWEPFQGKFNRGSQRLTYVDRLRKDTGLQTTAEWKTLLKDKCAWRAIARGDSTWWWWWYWYIKQYWDDYLISWVSCLDCCLVVYVWAILWC